jgi:hypothetical protein
MKPSPVRQLAGLLTGPKSASSSSGIPTLALFLGVLREGRDEVVVDPGPASTRVAAVQSWPALK